MSDNIKEATLIGLVAQQIRLYGSAILSRDNAAKLIRSHGDSIRTDYFSDPPKPLVTVRPVRALEIVR